MVHIRHKDVKIEVATIFPCCFSQCLHQIVKVGWFLREYPCDFEGVIFERSSFYFACKLHCDVGRWEVDITSVPDTDGSDWLSLETTIYPVFVVFWYTFDNYHGDICSLENSCDPLDRSNVFGLPSLVPISLFWHVGSLA